jgi:hypothetical protein
LPGEQVRASGGYRASALEIRYKDGMTNIAPAQDGSRPVEARSRHPLWLALAGLAALLAAGVFLWAAQSESLFASYLIATIANCF